MTTSGPDWPTSIDSWPDPTVARAVATAAQEAATDWEGTVERARANLLDFTRFTKSAYIVNWHHRLICEYLDDVWAGRLRRLLITIGPRMGKTELVCVRQPAFWFGHNPDCEIISATYAQERAKEVSLELQDTMESAEYAVLFGQRLPEKGDKERRTQDMFRVMGGKGRYRAAGVGVGITGTGGDLLLCDDLIKDDVEAQSPTTREKVWRWYTKVLFERRSKTDAIVGIMTRWHRDDWIGRLLRMSQELGTEQWELVNLPSLRPAEKTHPKDPRQEGEALWPYRRPKESLLQTQKQDRAAFAAIHQQNPSEAGLTAWPEEYFGDWIWVQEDDWPAPSELGFKGIAVDPSLGKGDKQHDYSAIVFCGFHGKKGLVYIDASIERRPANRIVRDACEMARRYQVDAVGVEANAFQELLYADIKRARAESEGHWLPVPIENTLAKDIRIRKIGPYLVDRCLRFRARSAGCRILVDQLLDFPGADHDDGPDALEMGLRLPHLVKEMV